MLQGMLQLHQVANTVHLRLDMLTSRMSEKLQSNPEMEAR